MFQYPEGWKAFQYKLNVDLFLCTPETWFQYPEGWKAFRYQRFPLFGREGVTKFQYPEGWKAFRYKTVWKIWHRLLSVSIPRRVEGLPIQSAEKYDEELNIYCFNTPKGGRPSDTATFRGIITDSPKNTPIYCIKTVREH